MLRSTYLFSAMILLSTISSSFTHYHPGYSSQVAPVVANGRCTAPNAISLTQPAVPALIPPASPMADGSGPMPPPIPLAIPDASLAYPV